VVVVVIALRWRWRRSIRNPPHEQWLVRLGAGGVSFALLPLLPFSLPAVSVVCRVSSSLLVTWPVACDVAVSTRDPPCEQQLAAVGRVLGCRLP
jgi:hypothetical protein